MDKNIIKNAKRNRRQKRIRAKIKGTAKAPRLSVFRSNKGMFLQLIDDTSGKTLISAYSKEIKSKDKKTGVAYKLGELIAEKAKAKKISTIVFDRGGYKFHGRVKEAAEGARKGGLIF